MAIQIITEVDFTHEEELVARALYAHNSYPGRSFDEAPWPPKNKSTMMRYLYLGRAVVKAQTRRALEREDR